MNYAEQCRAIAKPYREAGRSWADPKHAIAKEQLKLAALLDAAAALWEALAKSHDAPGADNGCSGCEAVAKADAAAKGAE